jgi:hypothetical protein
MSRTSGDVYKEGRLIDGYDYINQSWVKDGRYIACGHPDTMTCDCYGRKHTGETTAPGYLDGRPAETETDERGDSTPLARAHNEAQDEKARIKEARSPHVWKEAQARKDSETAVNLCRELLPTFDKHMTEKEKAFDWNEVDKATALVDKARNFSAYLDAREAELSDEVDYFVRLISKPGNDTPDNLRHRLTLLARLTEIRRTIQEIEKPYSPDMETDYSGELLGQ